MWNNVFNQASDQSRALLQPVVEFNQMVLRQAEKLGAAQLDVFNQYAQLGLRNLQAVAKVTDLEQARQFAGAQNEVFNAFGQRVSEDAGKFGALFDDFRKETVAFFGERAAVVAEAVKPVKAAAKA